MKLSNKILIGFFGFLFLYLTAVFAEIRFRGKLNVINDENSIAETVDIPGTAYLILEDLDQNIHVIGSDRPRLEVRSISGNALQDVNYTMSGDTLTIAQLKSAQGTSIRITIFVSSDGLRGLTVNSATAIVKSLKEKDLYISQDSGRIWLSDSNLDRIRMRASTSYLDISATELDSLAAQIDDSELIVSSPVTLLEGAMKNNSSVRMSRVNEIQFKKDESCRLNLY